VFSAGESIVYIDGSRRCSEVDGLWVCQRNEHIQVTADALLYTVLRRQVLLELLVYDSVGVNFHSSFL